MQRWLVSVETQEAADDGILSKMRVGNLSNTQCTGQTQQVGQHQCRELIEDALGQDFSSAGEERSHSEM